ncbi:integrase arm-type DNA-binding domain-containing protein [Paraburkholderia sp. USG1]|uniref:tyrosine-type recombinase/integrase n=1 Tax=Paraburkholderia sp. USG1 TaxID=2952268 RepID=UPI00286218AE|nr:integrase arm-type DNA-binding domain-containing protein [Paraburkholderia sp. USG1]MDR8398669.1 integrase arm-type DNA-binding domain-containing protein [Paraburkholderia sp. USG1]
MARGTSKLSARRVDELKVPGYYGDGGGLWLQVSKTITKSWIFRYSRYGKTHDLGLGAFPAVSLKTAREKAAEQRSILAAGGDPKMERAAAKATAANRMTFDQCSAAYIEAHRGGWKNVKHADQWTNTLATYASPIIGALDVGHIDTHHVIRILERDSLWTTKNETASRVRGRIERILAWAKTRKLRTGDNPATWLNHLDTLLPKPSQVQDESHFPALPYKNMNAFMRELRERPGVAARALEFTILTAARTNETIGATWDEIDLQNEVWIVPGPRMKRSRAHHIPLSPRSIEILNALCAERDAGKKISKNPYVFPSGDEGLSNAAMAKVIKIINGRRRKAGLPIWVDPMEGNRPVVPHGMRSSFRDWAGEVSHHAKEPIEHALAHKLADDSEAAYQRGALFDKRRILMNDWQTYIDTVQPDPQTAIAA